MFIYLRVDYPTDFGRLRAWLSTLLLHMFQKLYEFDGNVYPFI